MKHTLLSLCLLILFALVQNSTAKKPDAVDRGLDNYLAALNADNAGLLESAILNIIRLKIEYPERNYDKLVNRLEEIAREASSKSLKQKAFFAHMFLSHPDRYIWLTAGKESSVEERLSVLANRL